MKGKVCLLTLESCDCSLAVCVVCSSFPLTTGGLGHASPKVKEETLGWLRTAVCEEAKAALSKLAPLLLQPASKCAEEAFPSTREAALAFMVAFAIQVIRIRFCPSNVCVCVCLCVCVYVTGI